MEKFLKNMISTNIQGFLSYADFMKHALYHPELGYYSREQQKIGANGDFYTSSNVGDVFGRALGRWFVYIFRNFELDTRIIELGAGTGKIARSVLAIIKELDEQLFSKLIYTIVDTSSYHQELQKKSLENYTNVTYYNCLQEAGKLTGIIFSNEFFDAFPVHIVEKKNGQLYEVGIAVEQDAFVEQLIPVYNLEIEEYLNQQQLQLAEGQRIEIPLSMVHYYRELAEQIQKGLLLTIDYGYTNEEWRDPAHRDGSIRGYNRHKMTGNILKNPGNIDMTTHIHWDTLRFCPKELNVETVAFMPQNEFLMSCGIFAEFNETASLNPFSLEHKRNRAIRTLIEPGQISSYFKALVQVKNLEKAHENLFAPPLFY